jgi:hypothetical protein
MVFGRHESTRRDFGHFCMILFHLISVSYNGFSWFLRPNEHVDADTQNTDPHIHLNYLKIPVSPPYSKPQEMQINDLGLPVKPYYTTADVCSLLKIHPDTFRHRLRQGHYPESIKVSGKRRFQIDQIKNILKITAELLKNGILIS